MFENILKAKLKICEQSRNNQQSCDDAFFNQLIKTPCLFTFSQCKTSLCLCWRNTHDVSSIFCVREICCSISAQKITKEIFVKICWQLKTPTRTVTRTWKCTSCTICKWAYCTRQTFLSTETFANSPNKQNNKKPSKQVLIMINHCLRNPQINSIPE